MADEDEDYVYDEATGEWRPASDAARSEATGQDIVRDAAGTPLADGDQVTLIKDLKVKGSGGVTLKRGTLVKKIRLTGDPDEIEANVDKVRGLVLRTEFVKKA
jgi:protein PhnA